MAKCWMWKLALLALFLSGLVLNGSAGSASANFMPYEDLPRIQILGDGTIYPTTSPVQRNGEIYTLTNDIKNSILEVSRPNIIVDGAGHTVYYQQIEWPALTGIDLSYATEVTLRNVKVTGFHQGIRLYHSAGIRIQNCTLTGNEIGVTIIYSGNGHIQGSAIRNNRNGFMLGACDHIEISGNNITRNDGGITLNLSPGAANDITIFGNNITENTGNAIEIGGSSNTTVIGNYLADNKCGIRVSGSNNSTKVYHNNFVNNDQSVAVSGALCLWDNGKEGNYWSDYSGADSNGDGIGDIPYIIERARNVSKVLPDRYGQQTLYNWIDGIDTQDSFPLIGPWGRSSITMEYPKNETYMGNVPLNFTASKSTRYVFYSLDGQEEINLEGNTTLTSLTVGSHILIVRASDADGNPGETKTIYFTVAGAPSSTLSPIETLFTTYPQISTQQPEIQSVLSFSNEKVWVGVVLLMALAAAIAAFILRRRR